MKSCRDRADYPREVARAQRSTVRLGEDRKANPISQRINPKNWSFWHNPSTETGVILLVVVAEQGDHGSKDNEDEDMDGDRQHGQTSRP
jgi:hypothetical protein